jgi:hypothetical protein
MPHATPVPYLRSITVEPPDFSAWLLPGLPGYSPSSIAKAFHLETGALADLARVHRSTLTARPMLPSVQKPLRQLVQLVAIASELTGSVESAITMLVTAPLRPFAYRTALEVVAEGRAEAVRAYLESRLSGATG